MKVLFHLLKKWYNLNMHNHFYMTWLFAKYELLFTRHPFQRLAIASVFVYSWSAAHDKILIY